MALSNIFVKVFCIKGFYKIILGYCINSRVCNYGKRAVIGPLWKWCRVTRCPWVLVPVWYQDLGAR